MAQDDAQDDRSRGSGSRRRAGAPASQRNGQGEAVAARLKKAFDALSAEPVPAHLVGVLGAQRRDRRQ